MRTPSVYSLDDPISVALQPPSNETEQERTLRLEAEAEAKRLSDQIDEDLQQERERLKRNKDDIKLLLLGEPENMMKQFQLMYKPHLFEQERLYWKTDIYFNVVRSLKQILTTLEAWDDTSEDETDYSPGPYSRRPDGFPDQISPPTSFLYLSAGFSSKLENFSSMIYTSFPKNAGACQIADLRRRLRPLVSTYEPLADQLYGIKKSRNSHDRVQDILVPDVTYTLLRTSEKDIKELWDHTTVRALIAKRRLKLDEGSEFFLNHISRVVEPDYVPSTDDILHARIQSIGVQEYVFDANIHGKPITWHMYDIGGACGKLHSWVSYLDDINAIIFVVPVSDFDQYLEKDPRVNRIDNSLRLFTQICSNNLLKHAHVILILNKTDLLKAKLDKGVKVRKYITSFGRRSNDYDTVIQYFRAHFLQVHRRNNENRRVLYTHVTDVIDTKIVQRIVANVHDSIFREYLESSRI